MSEEEALRLVRQACQDVQQRAGDSEAAFLREMGWLEIKTPKLSEAFEMIGLLRVQRGQVTRH
jgi:hypothetical protein